MSRIAMAATGALAACSIPDTTFRPTPDGGELTSVLAINASVSSFDVDEGGRTDFMVTLTQAPGAELVVKVAPGDAVSTAAIGISLPELRFQPTSFDKPQTITVTGLPDVDAVDAQATISLSASGVDTLTLNATVRDHDKVEIFTDIAGNGVLSVNELDSTAVRVHLTHKPAADVRVRAVLGAGPVTVTPAEHTFTPANYDVDQTFTFTAPDDPNIVSEDQSLTFQAVGLADRAYTIHDIDKDSLNIRATPSTMAIAEGGGNQLSVTLTKQPGGNTTVHLDLQRGNVAIDHTDLTFTPQNFDQAQIVTVSAPQDLNTSNEQDTLTLSIPGSTVPIVTVNLSTVDDDVQAILANAPNPLTVTENQTAAFGVTLKFQPASTVTVTVTSVDGNVATASPGTLTFTPQDYADAALHQVTVRGADDNNLAANATTIRLREPTLVDKLVAVNVPDDDSQQLVVSTTSLMVREGTTATFDVALRFDPGTTVTATISNTNAAALPSSPSSITFTGGPGGNWATPVRVSVTPPVDTNNAAETAVITVHGAGAPDVVVNASVVDPTVLASYGYPPTPQPFGGSITLARGTVIAFKVPVPITTTLDAFGVYVPGGVGDFRMALYADANGAPGALVAATPRQAIVPGANLANLLPDSADPVIPVGTYWVAIRVAQSTALAQSTNVGANDCFTNSTINDLDASWPDPFGLHQCQMDNAVNLWINTYHQ